MQRHRNRKSERFIRATVLTFLLLILNSLIASVGFARSALDPNLHRILGRCFISGLAASNSSGEYKTICFRRSGRGVISIMDPEAMDGIEDGFNYTVKNNVLLLSAAGDIRTCDPQRCGLELSNVNSGFVLSNCKFSGHWAETADPFNLKPKK